jgi:hypothetical protein
MSMNVLVAQTQRRLLSPEVPELFLINGNKVLTDQPDGRMQQALVLQHQRSLHQAQPQEQLIIGF